MAGVTPLMGGAMGQSDSGVLNHEMSMVLTGLSEFKDELMQLHALVMLSIARIGVLFDNVHCGKVSSLALEAHQ